MVKIFKQEATNNLKNCQRQLDKLRCSEIEQSVKKAKILLFLKALKIREESTNNRNNGSISSTEKY